MSKAYEMVIGLETHVELRTRSKVFCACPNVFGAEPNTHVCLSLIHICAPVSGQRASLVLGKAMTSRSEGTPSSSMHSRSTPKANPAWGGVPKRKASSKNPKRSRASSLSKPRARNTFCWISARWMRTLPLPSSTPLRTTS